VAKRDRAASKQHYNSLYRLTNHNIKITSKNGEFREISGISPFFHNSRKLETVPNKIHLFITQFGFKSKWRICPYAGRSWRNKEAKPDNLPSSLMSLNIIRIWKYSGNDPRLHFMLA